MTNALIKDTQIVTDVTSTFIPGDPGSPATPGYVTWEKKEYSYWGVPGGPKPGTGEGHWYFVGFGIDPSGQNVGLVYGTWKPTPGGGLGKYQTVTLQLLSAYIDVPVQHPATKAIPPKPGSTVLSQVQRTSYNLGWNAGARSIGFFFEDGFVEFQCNAGVVGVICGINFHAGASDYNGNLINYAFYLARGKVHIMQSGTVGAFVGNFTKATVFHIERSGTGIIWKIDGTTVFSVSTGVPTTDGVLEASLYSGGDQVFNPSITQVSPPDISEQIGTINASFAPMGAVMYSGKVAGISASFEPMTGKMTAGLIQPQFAVIQGSFAPMDSMMIAKTGEVAQIDASFRPMEVLAADHPYGEVFAEFAPLGGYIDASEGNFQATIADSILALSAMTAKQFLVVVMKSSAVISATIASDVHVDAVMLSQATLGIDFAIQQTLNAVMLSLATSGWVLGVPEEEAEVWVVNLDNNGSTTYSNYAFNSFALWGDEYYGAGPEGVFALSGDTDEGVPVEARMSFGTRDFGTRTKKTVQNAYVGTAASGGLYIKIMAEGQEYLYRIRDYNPALQQQRFTFGKGLRTNYVGIELFNEGGADFEVDNLTFIVADMTRKI